MNKEVLSRKEKERLFKRAAIMDAAVIILAKKGYRDTTLDEIAITSEFGKGTIYNYFKSKEEIYSAIIEEVSKSLYQIIQEADLTCKRPGNGLLPKWFDRVVGRKAAKKIQKEETLELNSIIWSD